MRQLTINNTDWLTFRDTLAELEPFVTYGNLRGVVGCPASLGYLPEPHRTDYRERRDFIAYVVLSYGTPIAWLDSERGWIMPDVRYSVSTSKAQSRIAPAIAALALNSK